MNYVAFDLGGSGGKIVLGTYENHRLSIRTLHQFGHGPVSLSGGLYWNILEIYRELVHGLRIAVNITGDDIRSLGIDSFCNDYAFVSPAGELLSQVHCYRDDRTIKHAGEIYGIMSPSELYRVNGNQNASFNTLMQLASMYFEKQTYYYQEGNRLLFIPDLLIYFLSGRQQTEYTLASVSQLYDYDLKTWSPVILDRYQIPSHIFADISYPGTMIGKTTEEFNAQLNTKGFQIAAVCEHDTASAFLAAQAGQDQAMISCGTWALIGTETELPIINEYGFQYNIANEGSYHGHHRILRNVMGTWIIQQIRAYYRERGTDYSYSQLEEMAALASPFQYVIDVDEEVFFSPENMPEKIRNNCRKRYGDVHLSVGEMVRCVYESLACKYRWNLKLLEKHTGKTFTGIHIVGGGAQSKLMCQFTANACGLPVYAGPAEATAIGNIMMQLMADGQIRSVEEGRALVKEAFPCREYQPQDPALWKDYYDGFLSIQITTQ